MSHLVVRLPLQRQPRLVHRLRWSLPQRRLFQRTVFQYYHHSGTIELEYYNAKGIALSVVIYLVPETAQKTKMVVRTYVKGKTLLSYFKMKALFPFQYIAFLQDKRILEIQQANLTHEPSFKPMVTKTDLMRPYIVKAFNHDITPTHREKQLLL